MRFLVTLEPDEDGWIVVDCPALPGCVSQGRTHEEALRNIGEAIQLSLQTRRANGLQWPQLKGQFMIDRDGIVRWVNIECATEGLAGVGKFPTEEEVLAAAHALPRG